LVAWLVLKEKITWNYGVSFGLIMLAVWFATAFKPSDTPPAGH
jgi:drug/metabolite transporter (DMT)-like permease